MRLNGFNAADVEPATPRGAIPAGKYKCVITASEEKPTRAMTGTKLALTMQVIEGPHQGAYVFDNLNVNNPSATAQEIAQRQLSAICRAVGVYTPQDSSDLHNKPLMVTVKMETSEQYGAQNKVGGYEACEKGAAAAGNGAAAAGAAQAGTASGTAVPPWKR